MAEPIDSVDDNRCQSDIQTPGMMAGTATLPPKIARHVEQQERGQFAQALAAALRKPKTEEAK